MSSSKLSPMSKLFQEGAYLNRTAYHFQIMNIFGANGELGQSCRRPNDRRWHWDREGLDFSLIGQDGGEKYSMWRHLVGRDWIASMYIISISEDDLFRLTPLRIRGNVSAAHDAIVQAYLKYL